MHTHREQYKNSAAISLNNQPLFLQQSAGLHVLPLTSVGMKIGINCIKLNQKSFFFVWHMDNNAVEVQFCKKYYDHDSLSEVHSRADYLATF